MRSWRNTWIACSMPRRRHKREDYQAAAGPSTPTADVVPAARPYSAAQFLGLIQKIAVAAEPAGDRAGGGEAARVATPSERVWMRTSTTGVFRNLPSTRPIMPATARSAAVYPPLVEMVEQAHGREVHTGWGDLGELRADLDRAIELDPSDAEVIAAVLARGAGLVLGYSHRAEQAYRWTRACLLSGGSAGHVAAVDVELKPGDEGGIVAGQVCDTGGDLGGLPGAAKRGQAGHRVLGRHFPDRVE